jgi:pimeloyl-ACP methyl ester carboxylesterase
VPGTAATGAVRSSAWIWPFSSTQSTTACSGGSRYNPTTSTTFASSFLRHVDRAYPGVEPHLVMDNYAHKHPAVKAWLEDNPRVHVHFTHQELQVAVPFLAPAGHLPGRDVQRGEQGGPAVSDVVVGATLDQVRLHRQYQARGRTVRPTLIIRGGRDDLLVLLVQQDQEALAVAIPGSRLVVYNDTGHLVLWEQPQRGGQRSDRFPHEPVRLTIGRQRQRRGWRTSVGPGLAGFHGRWLRGAG